MRSCHPKARPAEEPPDRQVVLIGQHLGRRHERHLEVVLHRHERGQQRHDRLARSDVALEEAVHRLRLAQVVHDRPERRLLPRREREREHAAG